MSIQWHLPCHTHQQAKIATALWLPAGLQCLRLNSSLVVVAVEVNSLMLVVMPSWVWLWLAEHNALLNVTSVSVFWILYHLNARHHSVFRLRKQLLFLVNVSGSWWGAVSESVNRNPLYEVQWSTIFFFFKLSEIKYCTWVKKMFTFKFGKISCA